MSARGNYIVLGPQDCEGIVCGYQIAGHVYAISPEEALKTVVPDFYGGRTFPEGSYLVVPLEHVVSFEVEQGTHVADPLRGSRVSACPSPLPPAYVAWETWRLAGGIKAERPPGLPQRIPQTWWACLRERRPKPAFDYGLLAKSGWFVREPTGGGLTEKLPAVKAAGFAYVALNARDYRGNAWDEWRIEAARLSLPVVPWGRIYDGSPTSLTRTLVAEQTVTYLLDTAAEWGSKGVALNIEDEAEHTISPGRVAYMTDLYRGSLAIVTDWRGYLDAGVYKGPDWTPLAGRAVNIIEAFTNDDQPRDIGDCVERARLQGWKNIVPLLDTKLAPAVYQQQSAHAPVIAGYVLDIVDANAVAGWKP